MKFLDTMTKLKAFLDLFKKSSEEETPARKKMRRIALVVGILLALVLLALAIAWLVAKLKARRQRKEAEEEALAYYSTDFDADEYDSEEDEAFAE